MRIIRRIALVGALLASLGTAARGFLHRKMTVKLSLFGHKLAKNDLDAVQRIYKTVESRPERYELNLYVSGTDEDNEPQLVEGGHAK